jgi:hypothetical protein
MREESCRRKAVHFISRSDEFFAHQPPRALGTRAFIKYIRAPEHREAGPQPPLRCPRAHLRDSQSIELHKLPDSRRVHRGFIEQLRSNLRSLQKRVADVPGPKTLDYGHVVLFDAHLFDSTGAL